MTRLRAGGCAAACAACLAAVAAGSWTLEPVGECPMPTTWEGRPLGGLSGISRAAGDLYYAVRDDGSKGELFTLRIGVEAATGRATNCAIVCTARLKGREDLESVAWDRAAKCVWVGDESDGSIRGFRPDTGEEVARVDVPKIFDAYRYNRSFEALALSPDGRTLWTCNEEALCRAEAFLRTKWKRQKAVEEDTPDVDDGPVATRAEGSLVRLQRFTRASAAEPWRADGQWAYRTDGMGGRDFIKKSCCGVADLLALEDGTVFALEREMSIKDRAFMPSFRCRIYEVDRASATDVASTVSLKGAAFAPVAKRRVFAANTGFAMYEGICLGPELKNGTKTLVLVSDGGGSADESLLVLALSGGK